MILGSHGKIHTTRKSSENPSLRIYANSMVERQMAARLKVNSLMLDMKFSFMHSSLDCTMESENH